MDQRNVGQAPSTKRSKRLAVKKDKNKNKNSFSSLSKSSLFIQARVIELFTLLITNLKMSSIS